MLKLLLAAIAIVAATAVSPAVSRSEAAPALDWTDCDFGFECATLTVPLDHERTAGAQIDIALIRLPAADPDTRIGPLLLNPGGPGGSGIELARAAPFLFSGDVLRRFDIVGFDPRGVGASTPVDCIDDFAIFEDLDFTPDTPIEIRHLLDAAHEFADACQRRSGALLQHVNTESAARDMDLIREALGEEQISYLGLSYGTFLGGTYADIFPDRIRAFVLDGAIDPMLDAEALVVEQAQGFEVAFEAFLADCAARSDCAFTAPDGDLGRAYDELIARLEEQPLTSPEIGGVLDDSVALGLTRSALYDPPIGWVLLANAIRDAIEGDPFGFLILAGGVEPPDEDEDLTTMAESFNAIACADLLSINDEDEFRSILDAARDGAPRFGESAVPLECTFWPRIVDRREIGPFTAAGAPPILVVGTKRDPATPYQWSVRLASQLESATLLTYDGDGHTAFGRSSCAAAIIEAYLLELTLPAEGTVCPNEIPAPAPPVAAPTPAPPAPPAPTPAARVGITAPDTGFGPSNHRQPRLMLALGIATLAVGVAAAGSGYRRRTRR